MHCTSDGQRNLLGFDVYSVAHLTNINTAIGHLHVSDNQQSVLVVHASTRRQLTVFFLPFNIYRVLFAHSVTKREF